MPQKLAGNIKKTLKKSDDLVEIVGHLRRKDYPAFIKFLWEHQLLRYLFVGGSTFIIDLGLLVLGHEKAHLSVNVAATISYWTSIAYNFNLNRYWTFNQRELSALHRHALLYGCLLAFNYTFTIGFIHFTSGVLHYGPAKVIAVAIQMPWTYVIYKKYIFKSHIPPA